MTRLQSVEGVWKRQPVARWFFVCQEQVYNNTKLMSEWDIYGILYDIMTKLTYITVYKEYEMFIPFSSGLIWNKISGS